MSNALRVVSDSIPEHDPVFPPPHKRPPIHDFAPNDIPDISSSHPVRIGDLLHWLANTIVSRLPDPKPEKNNPTTPSSHHHARPYSFVEFQSPPLHLTPELLAAPITIHTLDLSRQFQDRLIDGYDEGRFTTRIVAPLVGTMVAIFSAVAGFARWQIETGTLEEYEPGKTLELDVVLYHKGGLVTAVEMKTPRSCNDPNIKSFRSDKPSNMHKKAKEICDHVGKQGKYLKSFSPMKPFVLHALSVAPGHLIPLASNGSRRFAKGSDVMDVSGNFPDAVRDVRNWLDYIDRLAAFTLAMVCHHDEDAAKEIGSRFPEQQKQIDELYAAADGALSPAAATGSETAVVPSDQQPQADAIWLSLGLELPEASSVYESHENIVYVHSRWGIRLVIKVFGEESSYAKELLSYQRLEKLQGKGIPVLYATGTMNARPCLVLSYEGERLREGPTEEQKATLYPVVKAMHDLDIHHHDLHRRNVVQNTSGKLTLIDFGLSEPCTRDGCEDEWQADEWY
ncbi:protein kinase subdomain-containing protein PKL/ccin4 [Coprinopsis cinerea okayama7|uniref:Protein kinase subdomain-containing protein PKL/ccin4 n=1 Tax=Coprinopsis cinerea (strain Okayama-7 / 130 / ATCC MYA-4618 / FGSC 9003) TaxID=240176 RepID=A8NDF6_COPC7|nr:protein kinase subdomain-containing protein PKL/ccin4 [Coprinopsis cinerea okayama7\|eukprot:XP_001832761.2 protein kinase subdomain-containing protein PKL/ccin4 [Coprinopsis cinerea okayama7\